VVIEEQTRQRIAQLLGRDPRGLEDVAVWSPTGEPQVIRVSALVDDKPFPTLYWLVDPDLCYRIDRAEAGGLIKQLQSVVDADPALQESMRADNVAYIRKREELMDAGTRDRLVELGFCDVMSAKGIGGLGDFTRIRCLHTWYAAHLVMPNTIGCALEEHWLTESGEYR